MKGVILAGGSGTRLAPLTKITSKQLLPVYDRPMIYYPLETLLRAGIREIFIITAPQSGGDFLKLLGSGSDFGAKFTYEIQDAPMGIAQGLSLAENFVGDDSCCLILGDNMFEDDFSTDLKNFDSGAQIFLKEVENPSRFGVVEIDNTRKVVSIEEKPKDPKSNYVAVGIYAYDNKVFDYIRTLKPSPRGELEITDLNNLYLSKGELQAGVIRGEWFDAGTFESLFESAQFMRERALRRASEEGHAQDFSQMFYDRNKHK